MQLKRYVSRRELQEAEQDIKRVWKMILILLILARRLSQSIPVRDKGREEKAKPEEVSLTRSILFIDKDPIWADQLFSVLNQGGFKAVVARSCTEGLAELLKVNPDLVILDLDLPNSKDTCLEIRERLNVPIILLGSYPDSEGWERAVQWGADAYLRRSMSTQELAARIKAILRRYQRGSSPDDALSR
jgi:CheY-like chemotaxis protein